MGKAICEMLAGRVDKHKTVGCHLLNTRGLIAVNSCFIVLVLQLYSVSHRVYITPYFTCSCKALTTIAPYRTKQESRNARRFGPPNLIV